MLLCLPSIRFYTRRTTGRRRRSPAHTNIRREDKAKTRPWWQRRGDRRARPCGRACAKGHPAGIEAQAHMGDSSMAAICCRARRTRRAYRARDACTCNNLLLFISLAGSSETGEATQAHTHSQGTHARIHWSSHAHIHPSNHAAIHPSTTHAPIDWDSRPGRGKHVRRVLTQRPEAEWIASGGVSGGCIPGARRGGAAKSPWGPNSCSRRVKGLSN